MRELNQVLVVGPVKVTFTKINGEQRVMTCTKDLSMIPEHDHPKPGSTHKVNPGITTVYDLEKHAWRSFRTNSVTEWSTA